MKPILILFALATLASARIGETPAQCTARYGEPVEIVKEDHHMKFEKSGMRILAYFFEGKAQRILIVKTETDALDIPAELSAAELSTLLQANSNGSKWKPMEGDGMKVRFETLDEKTYAEYHRGEHYLYLTTYAFDKHTAAKNEAAEKKALEGF